MFFVETRFKNFLSYGNNITTVPLNTNKITNIIGENGKGKSVLLDVIHYALTNKPFRNIKLSQLQNMINKKNLLVELDMKSGEKSITIKRGMNPSVFEIIINGIPLKEEATTGDFQTILENILNFNPKTLRHSIIMSSMGYIPFLEMKASDKRLFLDDLLNVDIFTKMGVYLKKDFSIVKDNIRDQELTIEKLDSNLKIIREMNAKAKVNNDTEILELKLSIDKEKEIILQQKTNAVDSFIIDNSRAIFELEKEHETEVENFKTNNTSNINQLKGHSDKVAKEVEDLKNINIEKEKLLVEYNEKQETTKKLKEEKFNFLTSKNNELDTKKKEYTNRLRVVEDKVIIIKKNIKDEEKQLAFLDTNVTCSHCKQQIDPKFKDEEVSLRTAKINEYKKEMVECDKEKVDLEIFKDKLSAFRIKIDGVNGKFLELTHELNNIGYKIEGIKSDIRTNERLIEEKQKTITLNSNKAKELEDTFETRLKTVEMKYCLKIDALKNTQPKIDAINNDFNKRIERYTDEVNKKIEKLSQPVNVELKDENIILNQLLDEKNKLDKINYKKKIYEAAINMCSDKAIKASIVNKYIPVINQYVNEYLDVLEAPYRMKFDENFDEQIVARGYEKLSYGNFSSGERARCDLALLFAFLDVSKIKNSINSNILILDEVADSSLDKKGISGVISILGKLKSKGYTPIVISHRDEIKNDFEVTYNATKEIFSKLEEI